MTPTRRLSDQECVAAVIETALGVAFDAADEHRRLHGDEDAHLAEMHDGHREKIEWLRRLTPDRVREIFARRGAPPVPPVPAGTAPPQSPAPVSYAREPEPPPPPVINVTVNMAEPKAPEVKVDVRPVIHVPAQEAPVVNVAAPPPAQVTVENRVDVSPTPLTVENRVDVAPTPVMVENRVETHPEQYARRDGAGPMEVIVRAMPVREHTIERDEEGNAKRSVERDA